MSFEEIKAGLTKAHDESNEAAGHGAVAESKIGEAVGTLQSIKDELDALVGRFTMACNNLFESSQSVQAAHGNAESAHGIVHAQLEGAGSPEAEAARQATSSLYGKTEQARDGAVMVCGEEGIQYPTEIAAAAKLVEEMIGRAVAQQSVTGEIAPLGSQAASAISDCRASL